MDLDFICYRHCDGHGFVYHTRQCTHPESGVSVEVDVDVTGGSKYAGFPLAERENGNGIDSSVRITAVG